MVYLTTACDGLPRPEELVGGLAIREATAEVVSRGCRHSENRRVPVGMFLAINPAICFVCNDNFWK